MNIYYDILIAVNILSIILLILVIPINFYDRFRGRDRANQLLKKMDFEIKMETVEIYSLVILGITFITSTIRIFVE